MHFGIIIWGEVKAISGGRGTCPREGQQQALHLLTSHLPPSSQTQIPPVGIPTAKMMLETVTTPLPQLLAERKSVRWDEEEQQDEAREPC